MAKSTNTRPTPVRRPRVSKAAGESPAASAAKIVAMETRSVDQAEIAGRAYELFLADGSCHGRDVDHWLQAERELLEGRLTSAA